MTAMKVSRDIIGFELVCRRVAHSQQHTENQGDRNQQAVPVYRHAENGNA